MSCLASACVLLIGATQTIGSGPARVILLQSGEGMTVIYENRIVSSQYVEPFQVDIDGRVVTGVISARNAEKPDDLVVYPPPGYQCAPCSITVDEGESGAVELFPQVLG